jgi:ribosomal-protein-alanine N-acetyltransferase
MSDAESFVRIYSDEEYFKYTRIPQPYALELAQEYIGKEREPDMYMVIVEKESGNLVGAIELMDLDREDMNAKIGFSIGKDYSNKGYMTEAAAAFIDFFFRQFGLERIEIGCDVGNKARKRVIEKLGAVEEGIARKVANINIGFSDGYVHSILREEWKPLVRYEVR